MTKNLTETRVYLGKEGYSRVKMVALHIDTPPPPPLVRVIEGLTFYSDEWIRISKRDANLNFYLISDNTHANACSTLFLSHRCHAVL